MPENGDVERQLIRRARGKFAAMVGAYAFGVFNDNFFKQAASLMALSAGLGKLQGVAAAAFSVPFMLFAAPAGWLADRFPKRTIVIAAKMLEVLAMIAGAWGICVGSWTLILLMVFIMGLQATIFSPALNGSIPELYPESYVLKANSIVKMITTGAILLGIILAGQPLNYKEPVWQSVPLGHWLVAGGVLAVSLAGLIASLFVPSRPAAAPTAKFPLERAMGHGPGSLGAPPRSAVEHRSMGRCGRLVPRGPSDPFDQQDRPCTVRPVRRQYKHVGCGGTCGRSHRRAGMWPACILTDLASRAGAGRYRPGRGDASDGRRASLAGTRRRHADTHVGGPGCSADRGSGRGDPAGAPGEFHSNPSPSRSQRASHCRRQLRGLCRHVAGGAGLHSARQRVAGSDERIRLASRSDRVAGRLAPPGFAPTT